MALTYSPADPLNVITAFSTGYAQCHGHRLSGRRGARDNLLLHVGALEDGDRNRYRAGPPVLQDQGVRSGLQQVRPVEKARAAEAVARQLISVGSGDNGKEAANRRVAEGNRDELACDPVKSHVGVLSWSRCLYRDRITRQTSTGLYRFLDVLDAIDRCRNIDRGRGTRGDQQDSVRAGLGQRDAVQEACSVSTAGRLENAEVRGDQARGVGGPGGRVGQEDAHVMTRSAVERHVDILSRPAGDRGA